MPAILDLDPSPTSVGTARRFTVETLAGWERHDVSVTAALLVTELVTNAILHARTPVQVRLELIGDRVRVEVTDGSPARPSVRHHSLEATTGRGLALVARLSRAWGVLPADAGKTVWVEIQPNADERWTDDFVVLGDEADERPRGEGHSPERRSDMTGPGGGEVYLRPLRWSA